MPPQDCRRGDHVASGEEDDAGELEGSELEATPRLQRLRGSPPDDGTPRIPSFPTISSLLWCI
jgi:hypothetical protein